MEKGREFFDSMAADWDKNRKTDPSRIEFLMSLVSIGLGDRVLDVGTGTGVLLPHILSSVGEMGHIDAVDFSPRMLALAAEKISAKNVSFLCADILQRDLADNSYNLIISLNFFPHLTSLEDKRSYIGKAYKALNDGGQLVIMHDIPREKVNGVHEHKPETLNDRLPSARDTGGLLCEAGFSEVFGIEDDFIYFVRGIKNVAKK